VRVPPPPNFDTDDQARSDFIRQLTLRQLAQHEGSVGEPRVGEGPIPRTLVQYWHDRDQIPGDVRECLDTWTVLRDQGVLLRMFDDRSARAYIEQQYGRRQVAAFDRCRHPAMRSDYFRMCFVLADGGLYVDADDELRGDGWRDAYIGASLKVQPLCYDIETHGMLPSSEISRVDLSKDRRIFYVNNNPLAAPAGHPLLRLALNRSTALLLDGDPAPEIQATTGPGNLTASLATYAFRSLAGGREPDIELLLDWTSTCITRWDLGYRSDARNWRNMDRV
jgi:hypothetical protein